jgi:hypothetical protein
MTCSDKSSSLLQHELTTDLYKIIAQAISKGKTSLYWQNLLQNTYSLLHFKGILTRSS